jgi:type II secretory ATPase GspE/PulE/Tfp pilus assembly ATPase PilB-like protein
MPEARTFQNAPVTVSAMRTSGATVRGRVTVFDPQATELVVRTGALPGSTPEEEPEVHLATGDLAHVAFHRDSWTPPPLPAALLREFEIVTLTSRALRMTVLADPRCVDHPLGFYACPPSETSLFSEIFFFSESILTRIDKRPLGELLVESGVLQPRDVSRALEQQADEQSVLLGQVLVEKKLVEPADIEEANRKQGTLKASRMRLGEILVEEGLLSEADVQRALEEQKRHTNKRLGEVLVEMNLVSEQQISRVLASKFHLPFVNMDECEVSPEATKLVPAALIQKYGILPYVSDKTSVSIAFSDPLAMEAIDMLRFSIGKRIHPVIATPSQIRSYLEPFLESAPSDEEEDEREALEKGEEDAVVKLVDRIILDACRLNASDIHVEPNGHERELLVRFRVDGQCREYRKFPAIYRRQLATRIKIMADLDIAERRKPQDGKIKFNLGNKKIELRVASIPTAASDEDVVMRILAASEPIPAEKLGLSLWNLKAVQRAVQRPYGLVLAVGPTGSGKTTTLHSLLGMINTGERKIWTAEDPIEITQPGLRQVQMNRKADLTFATAMRAFLRADPDVIMVGEMRDHETAAIGIEASLTGHLVFSTLHTNNAPETITRLLDMGLDSFTFSDALVCILAQRLARRLCPECRHLSDASAEERDELESYVGGDALKKVLGGEKLRLWRAGGEGCRKCEGNGYKGRLGIHELLVNSEAVRACIQHKGTASEIRELALREGMRTLVQDGREKALAGATDLRQVLSVCVQ